MTAKLHSQSASALSVPVVTLVDDIPTTLSTDVAAYFGKRHDSVIRAIEKLIGTLPEYRLHNFVETIVERENPKGGAAIESKAYRLTRDGFTFLAMGFTGAKAQAFKWSYIDAFNRLEASTSRATAKPLLGVESPAIEINLYGTRVDIESFTVCEYFGIDHKTFMENVSEYVRKHPYMLRRFELKTRARTVGNETVTQHYCTIDKPGLAAIIRDYYGENEELVRICNRFDPLLLDIHRYDYVDHPQKVIVNELARPIVRIEDNVAMTTTQDVAVYYGRKPEFVVDAAQKAAALLDIGIDDGSGKIISWPQWDEPGYLIGRDVFSFMVAGWKGVKDFARTKAYLQEFDIKDQAERDRQLDFVAKTSDNFARRALVTIEGDSVTAVRLSSRTMLITEDQLIERIEGKKDAFDLSVVRRISDAVFCRLNKEADHGF